MVNTDKIGRCLLKGSYYKSPITLLPQECYWLLTRNFNYLTKNDNLSEQELSEFNQIISALEVIPTRQELIIDYGFSNFKVRKFLRWVKFKTDG